MLKSINQFFKRGFKRIWIWKNLNSLKVF
jgi:hypothetical protein